MSKPSTGRIEELDAVRAFAAAAILIYHSHARVGWHPVDALLERGWLSVDLFFLLSGYLITSIILSHRVDRGFLWSFYARRALRIWPIYYLAIAVLVVLSHSGLMPATWPPFTGRLVLHYATFTQGIPNYWNDHTSYYHPIGHFWSLSVEEQFYLLWPFLIYLFGRRGVVPMSLLFIVTAEIYRELAATSMHLLLVRSDGLAYGAILAVLITGEGFAGNRRRYAAGFASVAAAVIALLAGSTLILPRPPTASKTLLLLFANPFSFGAVGLIVCLAGNPWLAPLRARWLGYLGQISYGLYVYHFIIYSLVDHCLGDGEETSRRLGLKLGLTLATAVISWRYYEKPILALKGRFPYDEPARGAAAPAG